MHTRHTHAGVIVTQTQNFHHIRHFSHTVQDNSTAQSLYKNKILHMVLILYAQQQHRNNIMPVLVKAIIQEIKRLIVEKKKEFYKNFSNKFII